MAAPDAPSRRAGPCEPQLSCSLAAAWPDGTPVAAMGTYGMEMENEGR